MKTVEQIMAANNILFSDETMDEGIKKLTGGGTAVKFGGDYIVCVDGNAPPHKKEFIAAHELAHILLGHLDGDMDKRQRERAEREAELFAVVLMAMKAAG